ncbi:MAG: phosphatidylserine decarboxylase family protein [Magnetovibrio sp.]|nr:phosphatidylserine decarboxylase family protein [Magnetovibrio sp.]
MYDSDKNFIAPYRVGAWLPSDQNFLDDWLKKLIAEAEKLAEEAFHPVIKNFQKFIENDATAYMLFTQMFDQVPRSAPYNKSPTGKPQVRNYMQMLFLFNYIMTQAPKYNDTGLVGFPINAILDWSMATEGGFAAFLNEDINAQFKLMLNEWAVYLSSAESCDVLNSSPGGWFSPAALSQMPNFVEDFKCDPKLPHYGFTSWDDFFTREFRDGVRPIADPHDDNIIVNACESAPYKIARDVKTRDTFWIKGQPYSLQHMLDNDEYVPHFENGTVYQAFLSALKYHRWHSPVAGRVVKTKIIDGTYYSETPYEGVDDAGPNESQGYITEVATRAIIYIQADNPAIGLMCFMAIGMAEVSTCDIRVYEGQRITKGQQLGMFHFGGSTHCLIFAHDVKLKFDLHGETPSLEANSIPINSRIATVIGD